MAVEKATGSGGGSGSPFPLAIAHDYLTQRGGAERVVLSLHRRWPDAPIYTTFYDPESTFPEFKDAHIITPSANRVSLLRSDPRRALPFLPFISSRIQVREPVAVVSSSGWAHGFHYAGSTLVYCHTPARWVYLLEDYLGAERSRSLKALAARSLRPALKIWDQSAVRRRTRYLANSTVVRNRIAATYGIDVPTVFPPHTISTGSEQSPIPEAERFIAEGFVLSVARLMPYKHVDVAIEAAARAGKSLLIVGKGPEEERLRAMAGPSVVFAHDVSDAQLSWAYAHASALIAISHEDFGITPLEASGWGVPTVALRAGGYLDTIVEGLNGVFVDAPQIEAVAEGISRAAAREWDGDAMRRHADLFSERRFHAEIETHVESLIPSGLDDVGQRHG